METRKNKRENGQVLILGVFCLIVMMGFVSMTIDMGLFFHERRLTQNAVDAGALAGAQELPNANVASSVAQQWALSNEDVLAFDSLSVSFRCVVGDRNHDNLPDNGDVPAVCNPGASASFVCKAGRCAALCTSSATTKCNTIVVAASKDVPFRFAPVLSILDPSSKCIYSDCSTGTISGAACKGACGAAPDEPLDIVMIIDRTSSMSATELANAKTGAINGLTAFNPQRQQIALGVTGPSSNTQNCSNGGRGISTTNIAAGNWKPVNFSTDYVNAGGSINSGSLIVRTINCLNSSSVGTNLGDPTRVARQYLQSSGRSGVRKVIILFTDGAANEPAGSRPCNYANTEANAAKQANIEVYTIGYGLEAEFCSEPGGYSGVRATRLLADMATNSQDDHGGCTSTSGATAENNDGDHFLCMPTAGDLSAIFKQVAVQIITSGSTLISIPE